jgi:hypothetical protein
MIILISDEQNTVQNYQGNFITLSSSNLNNVENSLGKRNNIFSKFQ